MKNNDIFCVETITSKTNSTIVKIAKLLDKKYRKEESLFVCNGVKLIEEAFKFNARIKYIVLNNDVVFEEKVIDIIKKIKALGTSILCVSENVFLKLTDEKAPQGVIFVCEYFSEKHTFSTIAKNCDSGEKVLVLESLRDPGNLGTIIRNAAAFGVDRLVLSSDCADIYSPKVVRAAMGAVFKLKIDVVSDLKATLLGMKNGGYNLLGAALEKDSLLLGEYSLKPSDAVIIGNEGHGISSDVLSLCDNTLLIPMCDNTESLNAAMAATIIMWELHKI